MPSALRILAVDTATPCCSVAVRVGERLASEMTVVSDRTHSVHLLAMIREALKLADLTLPAIDGFAVSIGPGSFTGLRIGLSTVKALAFAAGKRCVGVSSLESLAWACLPWPGGIWALLDARKGEVYAGHYRERDGALERLAPERVLPLEAALHATATPHLFVGDGAERYRERIRSAMGGRARFAAPERHFPRAEVLARLAQPQFAAGRGVDPDHLVPFYLRQSDAELRLHGPSGDRAVPEG